MKKILIGSLIGGILVFGWQAAAHLFMHHHDLQYQQVKNDTEVLEVLAANITQEGQYYLPNLNLNATADQMEQLEKDMQGKPWAFVTYHPAYSSNMGLAALRSLFTAILCTAMFIWLMGANPGSTFSIFAKGLGIGFFAWLFIWYNYNIWLQTPWSVIKSELVDSVAAWGLCGIWLGYWLNRKKVNGQPQV